MAKLLNKLQEEAKMLIIGVQEPAEACELFKENYVDAHIALLSAIHKTHDNGRTGGRMQRGKSK